MRRIHLDHYVSTPVAPEVMTAMAPFVPNGGSAPGALHRDGLRARKAVAQARGQVAGLLNADSPDSVLFTSGGTESANLAIKGVAWAQANRGRHLVLTRAEHPAVSKSVQWLATQGWTITTVEVDGWGFLDPAAIEAALTSETTLVCVHHANADVGTVQRVTDIARVTNERGIPLFVDASASGGWLPIAVREWGICLVSLAPHRFHGPKGAGVLYRHRRVPLVPLLHGGIQEQALRAGTENVAAIVGAGAAAALAATELERRGRAAAAAQRVLWERIRQELDYAQLNGPVPGPGRSPVNLSVSVECVEGEGLALRLDMMGVAVSAGAACVGRAQEVPTVLAALGLPPELARSTVLMTLGEDNTPEEMSEAADRLVAAVRHLRSLSPSWDALRSGRRASLVKPA